MNLQNNPTERIQKIWDASVPFHGKSCALLALGVRICDTALTHLGLEEADPDRLVCVCENGGCCTDAIQIGLHCTSGKKHLLYYKTGRLIYSIYDLETTKSVRICTRPEIQRRIHTLRASDILSMPEEALFYFEIAHPLTRRTLQKVHRACNAPTEGSPLRDAGVQDSPDQFQKYDLSDNGFVRTPRRRR